MSTVKSLLFALTLSTGLIATLPCVCAKDTVDAWSASAGGSFTCGDRYNALIKQGKAALTKGDQAGALRSLLAARSQLHQCQQREKENVTGAIAIALNSLAPGRCQ
jgi:hypothetical protein